MDGGKWVNLEDFARIHKFTPREVNGFEYVELDMLLRLDAMREFEGERDSWYFDVNQFHRPFVQGRRLTYHGYITKDGKERCCAVDGVMRDKATRKALPLLRQWFIAERWGWGGIGLYPFWNTPGLHLDDRPLARFERGARWWRDSQGNYRDLGELLEFYGLWNLPHPNDGR